MHDEFSRGRCCWCCWTLRPPPSPWPSRSLCTTILCRRTRWDCVAAATIVTSHGIGIHRLIIICCLCVVVGGGVLGAGGISQHRPPLYSQRRWRRRAVRKDRDHGRHWRNMRFGGSFRDRREKKQYRKMVDCSIQRPGSLRQHHQQVKKNSKNLADRISSAAVASEFVIHICLDGGFRDVWFMLCRRVLSETWTSIRSNKWVFGLGAISLANSYLIVKRKTRRNIDGRWKIIVIKWKKKKI